MPLHGKPTAGRGVVLAVSTVKDSLPALSSWLDLNHRNGIDHNFVFVDDSSREVVDGLADMPGVTPIESETWWGSHRPSGLNVRQRINANALRVAATTAPGVEWVVHIDADEIALIDRTHLDALPASTRAVRLAPYEAVSSRQAPAGRAAVTSFKRLLTEPELDLLVALGVLSKATNNQYFHGHVSGKVAVRPTDDLWLGTHQVVNADGEKQPLAGSPRLQLLHNESYSAEEFVRKWTNLSTSGATVATRGTRSMLAEAVRCLLALDIPEAIRREFMLDLFDRHVSDDHALLGRLAFLVEIIPSAGTHRPSAPPETVAALEATLEDLQGADKISLIRGMDPPHSLDA